MTTIRTLTDLYDALHSFHWDHWMSDDPRVVQSGQFEFKRLTTLAKYIPGGMALVTEFSHWNMEKWDKAKNYPKPERPTEVCSVL